MTLPILSRQLPSRPPHIPSLPFTLGTFSALKPWLGGLCLVASVGGHIALLGLPLSSPADSGTDPLVIEPPLELMEVAVLPASAPEPLVPAADSRPLTPPPSSVVPQARVAAAAPPSPTAMTEGTASEAPEVNARPPEEPTTPALTPEPVVPVEPSQPEIPVEPEPYADFPHFQGAQPATCSGLASCWRSPVEGSWRGAARSLAANLESQGYTVDEVTGEVLPTDTGVHVFTVQKDGELPYYLNLVSVNDGVLYSMTPDPISIDLVTALQAL